MKILRLNICALFFFFFSSRSGFRKGIYTLLTNESSKLIEPFSLLTLHFFLCFPRKKVVGNIPTRLDRPPTPPSYLLAAQVTGTKRV